MRLPERLSMRMTQRRLTAAVLAASGVVLLLNALPSGGQQPTPDQPAIQLTVPASADRGRTPVSYELTLPAGVELLGPPAVRVVDQNETLVEFALMRIEQQTPTLIGLHRLWTKTYTPGTYQVTIEAPFRRPDGTTSTLVTPPRTLTVPARVPAP